MDRLLSSRTPRFLTQMDKFGGKSTAPNAFTAELDCLQVRPNRIHCVLLLLGLICYSIIIALLLSNNL